MIIYGLAQRFKNPFHRHTRPDTTIYHTLLLLQTLTAPLGFMGPYLCSNWHDSSPLEHKILCKNMQEKALLNDFTLE